MIECSLKMTAYGQVNQNYCSRSGLLLGASPLHCGKSSTGAPAGYRHAVARGP